MITLDEAKSSVKVPRPDFNNMWGRLKYQVKDKIFYIIITILILIIFLVVFFWRIVIYVGVGESGVLFRPFQNGTVTEQVFDEGIHFINPFNNMTIYDLRIQVVRHEFSVLTNRGLPVALKIAVRYKPIRPYLGLLHQDVGPDYPNKIILPQIESVLRKGLGVHSPEEIYTNEGLLLSKLTKEAIEEINHNYIHVEDVIIRSISLPDDVKQAIEDKLVQEQKLLAYDFRLKSEQQEAERKRIESKGIKDYAKNISETMDQNVLNWHGIQATLELAASPNSKVIVIGGGDNQLPLIMNTESGSEKVGPKAEAENDPLK